MTDHTVNAIIRLTSDAQRSQLQSLLDRGLHELSGIAARYGAHIVESSATVTK